MELFDETITLETKDLILRPLKKEDGHDIFVNIAHDKEVLKYFVMNYVENEEDYDIEKMISGFINNKRYLFGIELKETKEVIGIILQCDTPNDIFRASEVGYAIAKKYWNQGYTTQALKAMIELLFSRGLHKVYACHFEPNIASKKVMEKAGMIYEGRKIDETFYRGQYWNTHYYYLLNDEEAI